ncbi:MAG: disulfide bond formation protein B [Bauldia sp.]|nr:disulfide bond formation protein B [Bauldia sp.]
MLRRDTLAPAFVFILGLATILGAWSFQIFGGYLPCARCLQQRWLYYIGLPIAFVALVSALAGGPAWLARTALGLAGFVFLYGAYLGVYQAGAEWSWWPGPSDCGATGAATTTTGNLLDQLDNIRIVSCTTANFRFPAEWGLSFAGWNAIVSLVLGVVALLGAAKRSGAR